MGRLVYVIVVYLAYFAGMLVQKSSDEQNVYNIDTANTLFDLYENALRIAGNHYENYVLDVYVEGDNYEDSIFKADYDTYCNCRDSIQRIWDENL